MSSLEPVKSMYDVALRPRVLRTITREDLPDEKKPLDAPSKLSRIVAAVQTHRLLAESHAAADVKLTERWKSAVDNWVDRLLSLVSSSLMPDKCWAGICLLGVTCQECSSERFLASYSVWFEKLLLHIQSPADSQFVKVASCAAMSDLITRLSLFPSEKKDAVSHTGKLIQPLLKLLKEDSSESIWEGAIHLLCTIITSFPASLYRHYDNVETAVASKILYGSFGLNLKGKLAHCLALLPRSKGDETSWLSTMRKILLLVNGYLTEIFHGLEEDTRWSDAVRLLVPPGEDTPSTVWGQNLLDETSDKARNRSKLLSISTMMLSCSLMLTQSFPVQVAVPVRSLLTIIERVLMVDGTVPRAALPFVIASEQEFTCTELPSLHLDGLELLISVMKGLHSQLLPHVAYVVRLIKEYLKKCESPKSRAKVYSITKMLLLSMGVGTSIYVAKEVVDNALCDLSSSPDDTINHEAQSGLPGLGKRKLSTSETLGHPGALSHRKRKLGATGSLEQLQDSSGPDVSASDIHERTPLFVKIAALEALEALLTVGGAIKSESWRSKVDHVLIKLASNSCKGGWTNEEKDTSLLNGSPSIQSEFQLAALRALFASVLSPSSGRPPHLARALELFRRVKREAAPRTSEFCTFALFSLEVLIHPRGLPIETFPSGRQDMDRGLSDSDDDMYGMDSSNDTMVPQEVPRNYTDKLGPETLRIDPEDKIAMLQPLGEESFRETDCGPASATLDSDMRATDSMMVESMDLRESRPQLEKPEPSTVESRHQEATHNQQPGSSKETSNVMPATSPTGQNMESNDADALVSSHHNTSTDDKAAENKPEGFTFQRDTGNVDSGHESDDSFPDIVDVEPDSD